MTKRFEYAFEESEPNRIIFDYSPTEDEVLQVLMENGSPMLYLNRSGLLTLAKSLVKMSLGPYTNGFHIHLHKDFNADEPHCLTVMLVEDKPQEPT
jgi:hypothetical protein